VGPRDLQPERIVRLEPDAVVLLDQRRLPEEEIELRCGSAAEVADAIRTLAVRGAPAIGVAAAYGLALAALRGEDLDAAYEVLASSRPTAVNLRWALDELRDDPTPERARALHAEEVVRCQKMGQHAAELVSPRARLLTVRWMFCAEIVQPFGNASLSALCSFLEAVAAGSCRKACGTTA